MPCFPRNKTTSKNLMHSNDRSKETIPGKRGAPTNRVNTLKIYMLEYNRRLSANLPVSLWASSAWVSSLPPPPSTQTLGCHGNACGEGGRKEEGEAEVGGEEEGGVEEPRGSADASCLQSLGGCV